MDTRRGEMIFGSSDAAPEADSNGAFLGIFGADEDTDMRMRPDDGRGPDNPPINPQTNTERHRATFRGRSFETDQDATYSEAEGLIPSREEPDPLTHLPAVEIRQEGPFLLTHETQDSDMQMNGEEDTELTRTLEEIQRMLETTRHLEECIRCRDEMHRISEDPTMEMIDRREVISRITDAIGRPDISASLREMIDQDPDPHLVPTQPLPRPTTIENDPSLAIILDLQEKLWTITRERDVALHSKLAKIEYETHNAIAESHHSLRDQMETISKVTTQAIITDQITPILQTIAREGEMHHKMIQERLDNLEGSIQQDRECEPEGVTETHLETLKMAIDDQIANTGKANATTTCHHIDQWGHTLQENISNTHNAISEMLHLSTSGGEKQDHILQHLQTIESQQVRVESLNQMNARFETKIDAQEKALRDEAEVYHNATMSQIDRLAQYIDTQTQQTREYITKFQSTQDLSTLLEELIHASERRMTYTHLNEHQSLHKEIQELRKTLTTRLRHDENLLTQNSLDQCEQRLSHAVTSEARANIRNLSEQINTSQTAIIKNVTTIHTQLVQRIETLIHDRATRTSDSKLEARKQQQQVLTYTKETLNLQHELRMSQMETENLIKQILVQQTQQTQKDNSATVEDLLRNLVQYQQGKKETSDYKRQIMSEYLERYNQTLTQIYTAQQEQATRHSISILKQRLDAKLDQQHRELREHNRLNQLQLFRDIGRMKEQLTSQIRALQHSQTTNESVSTVVNTAQRQCIEQIKESQAEARASNQQEHANTQLLIQQGTQEIRHDIQELAKIRVPSETVIHQKETDQERFRELAQHITTTVSQAVTSVISAIQETQQMQMAVTSKYPDINPPDPPGSDPNAAEPHPVVIPTHITYNSITQQQINLSSTEHNTTVQVNNSQIITTQEQNDSDPTREHRYNNSRGDTANENRRVRENSGGRKDPNEEEEEDAPDSHPLIPDNEEADLKARIISALSQPTDQSTRKHIQRLMQLEWNPPPRRDIGLHTSTLDLLAATSPRLWPSVDEYSCPECAVTFKKHADKCIHQNRSHGIEDGDFIMQAICKLVGDDIHCYECQDEERKEIAYQHQCGFYGCQYQSTEYEQVYRHRTNSHRWGPTLRNLGPFWARMKQEVQYTSSPTNIEDEFPSIADLLGLHRKYQCPNCPYSHQAKTQVELHLRNKHHLRETKLIERYYEYKMGIDVDRDILLNHLDPGVTVDHTDSFEEYREGLNRIGWKKTDYTEATETEQARVYLKALALESIEQCALALTDIKRWRLEIEPSIKRSPLTMTSNVARLLEEWNPEDLPILDGRYECHICHKMYKFTTDLRSHLHNTHQQELEGNPLKRFIEHVTKRRIVSMRINALHKCDMEDHFPFCCTTPECTFKTYTLEQYQTHLACVTQATHARTAQLTQTLGEFWGPIKAYVDHYQKLPTIRDLLGYRERPYKICKLCNAITSSSKAKQHMKSHNEKEYNPNTQLETVKFWMEFSDEPIDTLIRNTEWKKLLWNGSRQDIEDLTDKMYQHIMQDNEEDIQEYKRIEAELIQTRAKEIDREEEQMNLFQPDDEVSDTPAPTEELDIIEEPDVPHNAYQDLIGMTRQEFLDLFLEDYTLPFILQVLTRRLRPTKDPTSLRLDILEQFNRYNLDALKAGYTCLQCNNKSPTEMHLYTHMGQKHGTPRHDWFTAALGNLLGKHITQEIISNGEVQPILISCCWHPRCQFIQADKEGLKCHIQRHHPQYAQDIKDYGILMATIRAHLREQRHPTPEDTIANPTIPKWTDILQPRPCVICKCGVALSCQSSMNKHWAHAHNKDTVGNWQAETHGGTVTFQITDDQIPQIPDPVVTPLNIRRAPSTPMRDRPQTYTDQDPAPEDPPQEQINQNQREIHRTCQTEPRGPRNTNRAQPGTIVPVDTSTYPDEDKIWAKRAQELLKLTEHGISIEMIKPKHVQQVRQGLAALFRQELNPLLKTQTMSWDAFEGQYLECCHRIREHIVTKQGKDPAHMYQHRSHSKNIDAMLLRAMNGQTIETNLKRLLKHIDKLATWQHQELTPSDKRKQANITAKVRATLTSIYPEEAEEMLTEIQGTEDQRQHVVDWIQSKIILAAQNKREIVNVRTTTDTIRKAYHEDPGTTFHRYIDPQVSPTCNIPIDTIQQHYEAVWSREITPIQEEVIENIATLDQDFSEDIINFILDEENITNVVKSRRKLSALGPDGIGYRLYQLAGKDGIIYLKTLFTKIIEAKKVPTDWLKARTILLHKKGDVNDINNWRPISITSCTYRIFTALISRALQTLNNRHQFFSHSQKGFIEKCNGCTEHSIIINELMADANRHKTDLVAVTIDCTNAFGSVPHTFIHKVMEKMNIPSIVRTLVQTMYTDATTRIETKLGHTEPINWRRGVKQGCPLSPLLFNMCLEPLLRTLATHHAKNGYIKGECKLQAQAYADDIVLIAQSPEGMHRLITATEKFMKGSGMTINPKKCCCASYMLNQSRRRCSLEMMKINNQPMKCLTLAESCTYLGSPLASNARARMQGTYTYLTKVETLTEKVMQSGLTINQKLHALKTFVIPQLDFRFLNTDISKAKLDDIDKHIRAQINRLFKIRGIPISNIHASWRDGGLSIPRLMDRQDTLAVRAFEQLYDSKDLTVRTLFRQLTEDERTTRKIREDNPGEFLTWNRKNTTQERKGTRTLISRTRNVAERRQIKLKEGADNQLTITMENKNFERKEFSKNTLGRFITTNLRKRYIEERKQHPKTCDRTQEAINNPESNYLIHSTRCNNDALTRFSIAARHDLLPTKHNLETWYNKEHTQCQCGCRGAEHQTLSHLLNSCGYQRRKIIARHDQVVGVLKELCAECLHNATLISENQRIMTATANKPDLVIETTDHLFIFDVTCPYGGTTQGSRSSETAFTKKITKYEELRKRLAEDKQKTATVIPVVVTSLGIVFRKSIQLIKQELKVADDRLKRFMKRLSIVALLGSFKIWREQLLETQQKEDLQEPETAEEPDPEPNEADFDFSEEEEHYEEASVFFDEESQDATTPDGTVLPPGIERLFHSTVHSGTANDSD